MRNLNKYAVIATVVACGLLARPSEAQVIACDPGSITTNVLSYVTNAYSAFTRSRCEQAFGVWACAWVPPAMNAGQTFALITFPAQVAQFCKRTADWYNCPTDGTQCRKVARVTCGGAPFVHWREQCSQVSARP